MTRIFISYRRSESANMSRRLYDALVDRAGDEQVFRDVDTIVKGRDFREAIERYIIESDVMLVVIGNQWLGVQDAETDKRRLDNPEDFVRIEVDMGLRHVQTVIPVLVNGAKMPSVNDLPRPLSSLAFKNAAQVRETHFDEDFTVLLETIGLANKKPSLLLVSVFIIVVASIILAGIGLNAGRGTQQQITTQVQVINDVEMVLVPGGTFMMGSDEGEDNELPIHEQHIETSFWISRYEITNSQYDVCVNSGVCSPLAYQDVPEFNSLQQPVVGVTWDDAVDYAEWNGMRLPTEAEWEYACTRTGTSYPWGEDASAATIIAAGNAPAPATIDTVNQRGHSWVGAYDLSGNVWEWTSTVYNQATYPYPYSSIDGRENTRSIDNNRVLRGGSFNNSYEDARCANREFDETSTVRPFYGFRVVYDPE